jgi:arylformamidase
MVELEITLSAKTYKIDLTQPIDVSIPLLFNREQPNFFGVPAAKSRAYAGNGFVGDTRQGGSCNVEEYSLIAHCNGTHTECVGHIVNQEISIQNVLQSAFIPATIITIKPEKVAATTESYIPEKQSDDLMITEKGIRNALQDAKEDFLNGLIIRTLPNDISKMNRDYNQHPAPFFSIEAMRCVVEAGVKHLLVDIPSVDRANDEGKMTCHHLLWEIEAGAKDIDQKNASRKTITEMVFLPDSIRDGCYFANIQIPPFVSDAAPSRPLLFKAEESS